MGENDPDADLDIDRFFSLTPSRHRTPTKTNRFSPLEKKLTDLCESINPIRNSASIPFSLTEERTAQTSSQSSSHHSFRPVVPLSPASLDALTIDEFFGLSTGTSDAVAMSGGSGGGGRAGDDSSRRTRTSPVKVQKTEGTKLEIELVNENQRGASLFGSTSAFRPSLSSFSSSSSSPPPAPSSSPSSSVSFSLSRAVPFSLQTPLPSFDSNVHGTSYSDHMQHKMHWSGYWENRIRKLQKQKPIQHIYQQIAQQMRKKEKEGRREKTNEK